MADAARGPAVRRPLAFASEERRAVHSWSRVSSAGHSVLLDALKILSPTSRDLSSTEELVTFLQELSEEGHTATVLRSKDVYGYRSCTVQPLSEGMLKPSNKNVRSAAKRRGKRPVTKRREVHPSWSTSERSSPRIQGVRPPELLLGHGPPVCSRTPSRTVETPKASQPCLRLTNIEGMSGFHTARLQIHTTWLDSSSEASSVAFSKREHPPALSGIPLQPCPDGGGTPPRAVALFSQKSLSCPVRVDGALIGDSAPVFYPNGRLLPQTHTELSSNGWRSSSNGFHQDGPGAKELHSQTRQRSGWKDKEGFRCKVIKVDDSRSVAEARRKAQKILQVNLSPVIQIQPLSFVLRDLRYQNK